MAVSPVVLKNKGVPVDVSVVEKHTEDVEGGDAVTTWETVTTAKGEAKTEKVWVRFDMNALAEIEARWGDLGKFQEAVAQKQFLTIRELFAILLDTDPVLAGKRLIPDRIGEYATAVGVALSIANGVDPTRAAQILELGVKVTRDQAEIRDHSIDEAIRKATPSTGKNSAANGSGQAEPGKSSGPGARSRSASPSPSTPES